MQLLDSIEYNGLKTVTSIESIRQLNFNELDVNMHDNALDGTLFEIPFN